jgi:hypothetical protein
VRGLHLASEPAAGWLHIAVPGATVVGFPDSLSCGRALTPRLDALDAWFAERHAFWREVSGDATESADLARLAASFRDAAAAPAVTLWLGTGPNDQLFAAWFAALVAGAAARPVVSVVQFTTATSPSGRPFEVASLGSLHVGQLEAAPAPQTLDGDAMTRLEAVWTAWASGSPDDLVRLRRDTRLDPWVLRALDCLLDRYPLAGFGINRWERRVLEHVAARGPSLVRAVAHTLADSTETADWIGDGWLYWRVRRLADPALAAPLVELDRPTPELRGRRAALTGAGAAVLAGEADAIDLNGIDDWVGGVHLHADRVWVRTPGGLARHGVSG